MQHKEDRLWVTAYNVRKCGLYESRTSESQGKPYFFFTYNVSLSQQISLISIIIFMCLVLLYNLVCLVFCLALFLLPLEEHNFIFSPFYVLFRVWVKYNPQNIVFTMSCLLEFEIISPFAIWILIFQTGKWGCEEPLDIPVLCQIWLH